MSKAIYLYVLVLVAKRIITQAEGRLLLVSLDARN